MCLKGNKGVKMNKPKYLINTYEYLKFGLGHSNGYIYIFSITCSMGTKWFLKNIKVIVALGKIGFDSCIYFFKKNYDFYKNVKFSHGAIYY